MKGGGSVAMVDSDSSSYNSSWYPLPPPPLPPLPASTLYRLNSQKSIPRVAFSEFPSKQQVTEKEPERREEKEDGDEEEVRHQCCFACCAWICLGLFAFAILILLIGLVFICILGSGLPEVRITGLDFPELDVDNKHDRLLNASVRKQIQVLNNNGRVELEYSHLKVEVSSEKIQLGRTTVPGFSQKAKNRTVLNASTRVSNTLVNEDDAKALKTNAKSRQIVAGMFLSGSIGYHVGALGMNRVPLQVVCKDIHEAQLYLRNDNSKCNVKIYNFLAHI